MGSNHQKHVTWLLQFFKWAVLRVLKPTVHCCFKAQCPCVFKSSFLKYKILYCSIYAMPWYVNNWNSGVLHLFIYSNQRWYRLLLLIIPDVPVCLQNPHASAWWVRNFLIIIRWNINSFIFKDCSKIFSCVHQVKLLVVTEFETDSGRWLGGSLHSYHRYS